MREGRRKNLPEEFGRQQQWQRTQVFPDPGFPLGIVYAEPQTPTPLHTHERFSEVAIVFAGSGVHFTAGEEYAVGPGDVFVITGDLAHGYKDVQGLELANLMFDQGQVLDRMPHVKKLPGYHALFHLEPRYRKQHRFKSRLRLKPDELSHALTLLDDLVDETQRRDEGYEFMTSALLMELVGFLCRTYLRSRRPESQGILTMGKVISYLESRYTEPVQLDDLTELAGLPKRSFMRAFHEATGLSPIDYLIRLRLGHAAESLRTADTSVTEIAMEVGFSDSNYFARQFRRVMGMTPTEYRARRRVFDLEAAGEAPVAP